MRKAIMKRSQLGSKYYRDSKVENGQMYKCTHTSKISLVHEDNVIFDDLELAKTFNNFFENPVDDLEIKEYESDLNLDTTSTDPIECARVKY